MGDTLRVFLPSAAFVGLLLFGGQPAKAASFDCTKAAAAIEHAICGDPDLNSLDSQLEGAYLGALDRSNDPAHLKEMQLAWLKRRDACADAKCLAPLYQQRIKALAAIDDEPPVCKGSTTVAVETCASEYSRRADRELARYVAAVRKRLVADGQEDAAPKKALAEFETAQATWTKYRQAECEAVYSWWSGGTIRGTMFQECWRSATKDRARAVWSTWLHFSDSTPPLLPEPAQN